MILLSNGGTNIQRAKAASDTIVVGTVDGIALLQKTERGWTQKHRALQGVFVSGVTALEDGTLFASTRGVGIARSDDDAARRGEQCAVLERGDAGHENARSARCFCIAAALGSLQDRNAIDRADHNRVGCGFGALDVGSAVRQQNHRTTRRRAIASHGQHNPEAAVPTTPAVVRC